MAITTQSCFRGAPVNTFALEIGAKRRGPSSTAATTSRRGRPDRTRAASPQRSGRRSTTPSALRRQPHRDPGRRVLVRGVHDRPGAAAARLQRSDRDHPRPAALHQRRLRRLPRHAPRSARRRTRRRSPSRSGEGEHSRSGNFAFNPFSDFLLHDMGALGDLIGNAPPDDPAGLGDSVATTRRMRTAAALGHSLPATSCCTTGAAATSPARSALTTDRARPRATRSTRSAANQHNLVQFARSL